MKNKLAGLSNYSHIITEGNKHIPSGRSTSHIIGYGGMSWSDAWENSTKVIIIDKYINKVNYE